MNLFGHYHSLYELFFFIVLFAAFGAVTGAYIGRAPAAGFERAPFAWGAMAELVFWLTVLAISVYLGIHFVLPFFGYTVRL